MRVYPQEPARLRSKCLLPLESLIFSTGSLQNLLHNTYYSKSQSTFSHTHTLLYLHHNASLTSVVLDSFLSLFFFSIFWLDSNKQEAKCSFFHDYSPHTHTNKHKQPVVIFTPLLFVIPFI